MDKAMMTVLEFERSPEPIVVHRDQLLRITEVVKLTGLGRSTIYERMNDGSFPIARQLGESAVAWPAGEVLDWIKALPIVEIKKAKARR